MQNISVKFIFLEKYFLPLSTKPPWLYAVVLQVFVLQRLLIFLITTDNQFIRQRLETYLPSNVDNGKRLGFFKQVIKP